MDRSVSTARPGRRRFRLSFRLRTLLIALLVPGVFVGWILNRCHEQRRTVYAVSVAGGWVTFDPNWEVLGNEVPVARWLGWLRNEEWFSRVVAIDFFEQSPAADDKLLARIGRLPDLRSLSLYKTNVSEDGIRTLLGLPKIESLDVTVESSASVWYDTIGRLSGLRVLSVRGVGPDDRDMASLAALRGLEGLTLPKGRITDRGFAHLSAMSELVVLDLGNSQVTTQGLWAIAGLKKLQWLLLDGSHVRSIKPLSELEGLDWLMLSNCPIDDEGLAGIERFTGLEMLGLAETRITDAVLDVVGRLKTLESLDLAGTRIGDDGVAQLAGLLELKELGLAQTRVTNAMIGEIQRFQKLQFLNVAGTRVTEEGVAALRKQSPILEIMFTYD